MNKETSIAIALMVALTSKFVYAATPESCLEIARTGMIVGEQMKMCGFGGNLKESLLGLYNAKKCGELVYRAELDRAAQEIISGMHSQYAQSGKKKFCADAKPYFPKEYPEFFEREKKKFIVGID